MRLITVENDEELLLKFWEAEKQTPRWFRDAGNAWVTSDIEFLEFCKSCWRIYLFLEEKAVMYVGKIGTIANIHLSLMPDADKANLIKELFEIEFDILEVECNSIIGWVAKQNRGLRRICEQLGLRFYGFSRFKGETHGKVIEWQCHGITKAEVFVLPNYMNVLSLSKQA